MRKRVGLKTARCCCLVGNISNGRRTFGLRNRLLVCFGANSGVTAAGRSLSAVVVGEQRLRVVLGVPCIVPTCAGLAVLEDRRICPFFLLAL